MNRFRRLAALMALLLLAGTGQMWGTLATDYVFINGTGSGYDMSSSSQIIPAGTSYDDYYSPTQSIGFDFNLGGQTMSYFMAGSNGPLVLGSSDRLSYPTVYAYESFTSSLCPHPIITAWFDDLVPSGNGVRTALFGTAPNRVRVIEWEGYVWYGSGTETDYIYQVRLYETSNKYELWYRTMGSSDQTNGNGQIGAALSTTDYNAVRLGTPPSAGASIAINDLSSTPIADNTLFTFQPCQKQFTIAGNTLQGGTPTMDSGATILPNLKSKVGSSATAQPFSISMGEFPCGDIVYTYSFSGAAASDFSISPSTGSIGSFQTLTPMITFTPSDTGVRTTTFRITGTNGFNRAYTINAIGYRCVDWVGNIAEGGTARLRNGDTLLGSKQVPIGSFATYTPIMINQLSSTAGCNAPIAVTYTLNDPTGNYSINVPSETIPVGGQAVPVIKFNAMNGVGYQNATLTINADGEVRTFVLHDFIAAPGGEIRYKGVAINSKTTLFREQYTCVGDGVLTVEFDAVNIGTGDFVVRGMSMARIDTLLRQGVPDYPFLRDEFGNILSSNDYFLSTTPGTTPITANQRFDSLVVPEGTSRKLYLNIVPSRSGRRYGHVYFSTNAFNLKGTDVNGDSVRGLVSSYVLAQGLGSYLTSGPDAGRPKPVVYADTRVRESREMTGLLFNDGDCDLKIDRERLRFVSGDIGDFELLNVSGATVNGDYYVLKPGTGMSVDVRFTPDRSGARRATLRVVTNDSSMVIDGVTKPGTLHWDFFGNGKIDLEARDLSLDPAVIGGTSSEGIVPIENTKTDGVTIDSIRIVGGNGEFVMDPNNPWPATPFVIGATEKLDLGILFVPAPNSAAGVREAEVQIFLSNGDTTFAKVIGYAGTRTLVANPTSLFQNRKVAVGELSRAYFTLTNNGTIPVVINNMKITGTDSALYSVTALKRRVLEPGQTEIFEATYVPQGIGQNSATIEVTSNATSGMVTITLGGEGVSTSPIPGAGSNGTENGNGNGAGRQGTSLGSAAASARLSMKVVPNPASATVALSFTAAADGTAAYDIYSADGRLVRTTDLGQIERGNQTVAVDLSSVSEGVYFVVLRTGDQVAVERVSVVR